MRVLKKPLIVRGMSYAFIVSCSMGLFIRHLAAVCVKHTQHPPFLGMGSNEGIIGLVLFAKLGM